MKKTLGAQFDSRLLTGKLKYCIPAELKADPNELSRRRAKPYVITVFLSKHFFSSGTICHIRNSFKHRSPANSDDALPAPLLARYFRTSPGPRDARSLPPRSAAPADGAGTGPALPAAGSPHAPAEPRSAAQRGPAVAEPQAAPEAAGPRNTGRAADPPGRRSRARAAEKLRRRRRGAQPGGQGQPVAPRVPPDAGPRGQGER